MRLAAVAGARSAEIVALRWDDLSGDRLTITRQRHSQGRTAIIREQTKTGGSRTVVLDAGTIEAIHAWHREADEIAGAPTEWMLSEPGASEPPSPRWLYEVFVRAGRSAGITTGRAGLVLHDLATGQRAPPCATAMTRVTVAASLGHSPETLLRVYAQEVEQGQEGVLGVVERTLDG